MERRETELGNQNRTCLISRNAERDGEISLNERTRHANDLHGLEQAKETISCVKDAEPYLKGYESRSSSDAHVQKCASSETFKELPTES